jgi:hypothetical protein
MPEAIVEVAAAELSFHQLRCTEGAAHLYKHSPQPIAKRNDVAEMILQLSHEACHAPMHPFATIVAIKAV